ncbi:hypothetical protein [Prevotella jejuni]
MCYLLFFYALCCDAFESCMAIVVDLAMLISGGDNTFSKWG